MAFGIVHICRVQSHNIDFFLFFLTPHPPWHTHKLCFFSNLAIDSPSIVSTAKWIKLHSCCTDACSFSFWIEKWASWVNHNSPVIDYDDSVFPYWNETQDGSMTRGKNCGGRLLKKLQNKYFFKLYQLWGLVIRVCCLTVHRRLWEGYSAPDGKLDFNDSYWFFSWPVRHRDDILAPLAHWCGWDLKCSLNILMYVRLVVQYMVHCHKNFTCVYMWHVWLW